MVVSKKAIKQYIMLYCMMLLNQSVIRDSFFSSDYMFLGIFFAVASLHNLFKRRNILFFMVASLAICAITRFLVGGVGIGIWATWMSMILVTYSAIEIDPRHFLDRLVKMVVFFAGISIILWAVSLIDLRVVQKLMLFQYKMRTNYFRVYIDSVQYDKMFYDAYGGLIYCVNMCHPTRNCGIFTEPGIYQIVLNGAIFVLIFLKKYLNIDSDKNFKYFVILSIAVITTQSTSGVISLAFMLFFVIAQRKFSKFEKRIILGVSVLAAALVIQYFVQGENSLLYKTVIKKLFSSSTGFSLAASSGSARLGTIAVCLLSMIQNPFGIGYDRLTLLLDTENTGFVAASIFMTGAACGVLMFALVLVWTLRPVFKTRVLNKYGKASFLLIYANTVLSQSSEFYPFIIFIPLILVKMRNQKQGGYWGRILESDEKGGSGELSECFVDH